MSAAKVAGGVFLIVAGLGAATYGVDEFALYRWILGCMARVLDQCAPWSPYTLQNLQLSGILFLVAALAAFVFGALLVWKGLSRDS
jgi:hypothetical protein